MEGAAARSSYVCFRCGASGDLPFVEGEASCPHCGNHLWTTTIRRNPVSIGPDPTCATRARRPLARVHRVWLARLCLLVGGRLARSWIHRREAVLWTRVKAIMEQVSRCADRDELERALGKPKYAIRGKNYGRAVNPDGSTTVCDVVECYETRGCWIDVEFTNGRVSSVIGVPKPTAWQLLAKRTAT